MAITVLLILQLRKLCPEGIPSLDLSFLNTRWGLASGAFTFFHDLLGDLEAPFLNEF